MNTRGMTTKALRQAKPTSEVLAELNRRAVEYLNGKRRYDKRHNQGEYAK